MKRVDLSPSLLCVLSAARCMTLENHGQTVVVLADVPYDFKAMKDRLEPLRIMVASDKPDVQTAAKEDGVPLIPLLRQSETRQAQISQALLEAIADDLLHAGERVIVMYCGFERDAIDTLSMINLGEQLARLTARDLRRLETQVPLETLRTVVDLAVEIGREGREGKRVGTMFVVGDHRKVINLSHEGVHDPFRGYSRKERELRDPRVRESIKEVAQLDGAFVIAAEGYVVSAGRILDAPAHGLTLSKGLGSRHWAAAAISKVTKAIAIAVSQSSGTVRLFQNGTIVLRIEPLSRAMKWNDFEVEPPGPGE